MKFNMRKKLVSVAVASALSGGAMLMAAPAQAMNVAQDNLGQVLLFPYYTVKNGFDTLLTITNTSDRTTVFKIRWREALNSREVRDFNVILSPYDVWTSVVTATTDGALVRTFDNTCTSPILPASGTVSGAREVGFTNSLFTGNFTDGATGDISRVKEGYFEVIEMGTSTRDPSVSTNTLEYNAKHVNGVPRDCGKVDNMFLTAGLVTLNGYILPPLNNLKGHSTFINVAQGKAIDVEPTAIQNFQSFGLIFAPGDVSPSIKDGDPVGNALQLINGTATSTPYATGSHDGLSDLLRATSVINEYATGTNAGTSWVVTFPTKHVYTDSYTATTGPTDKNKTPSGGFSEWFYTPSPGVKNGMSCDDIGLAVYNREEASFAPSGTDFSPSTTTSVELCYEVNVVDFNSSSVFGTGTNRLGLNTTSIGTAGWAELSFIEAPATTAGGLPVIGFAGIVRDTGAAIANYGSSVEHAYRRNLP